MTKAQPIVTEGILKELMRERSSPSGNPRFTLIIAKDDGDLVSVTTRPDSLHAYGITDFRDKRVRVTSSPSRGKLSLDDIEGMA